MYWIRPLSFRLPFARTAAVFFALLICLQVLNVQILYAQGPRLVDDLRMGTESYDLDVSWQAKEGDDVFLVANNGALGRELMKLEGDQLLPLTDICPGQCSSFESATFDDNNSNFTFLGDQVIFIPGDRFGQLPPDGLWSVPRAGGAVRQIIGGAVSEPTKLGDRVLFGLRSDSFQRELWSWDGETLQRIDEARSRRVPLVRSGDQVFFATSGFSSRLFVTDGFTSREIAVLPGDIGAIYPVGERVVIDLDNGGAVWSSDGSEQGTFEIAEFSPQGGYFAATPDRIIYSLLTPDFLGRRLWSTDGTLGGTTLLPTYCPSSCSTLVAERETTTNGTVFFFGSAPFPAPGQGVSALWRTDGTAAGTARVSEVGPVFGDISRDYLTSAGERAFFIVDIEGGEDLWVSDGTVPGTRRVIQLPANQRLLGGAGEDLIYLVFEPDNQQTQIWASDGTASGTRQLAEGTQPADIWFYSLGEELLLTLRDENNAGQIWRTDGTAAGTRALDGARASVGQGSRPYGLTAAGGSLYFSTVGAIQDPGYLYKTRGDAASTVRLDASLPREPHILGAAGQRVVMFGAGALFSTDGSAGGARMLADLDTSFASDVKAVALGDRLVISESLLDRVRLRITDGTPEGTSQLGDYETTGSTRVSSMHEIGGVAMADLGRGFFRTDGTPEGTFTILLPGQTNEATAVGDRLYFNLNFEDLWLSDGTPGGTRLVVRGADLSGLTALGGLRGGAQHLYFTTFAEVGDGLDLWTTTGTAASTRRLGLLPCDNCGFGAIDSAAVGDTVLFAWDDDGELGEELWRATPGSSPAPLKDICAGPCGSQVDGLQTIGDRVYFSAAGDASGLEPWVSDGTPEGTYPIADLEPGIASSQPAEFTALGGGQVFFSAFSRAQGRELWTFNLANGGSASLLGDGRFEVSARWRTAQGEGKARMQPFSDDTSFFWFFGRDNVELIIKVLDGRGFNQSFWVFYGALSNVEYWIDVRDRKTGRTRTYYNPPGEECGQADTSAFPQALVGDLHLGNFEIEKTETAAPAGPAEMIGSATGLFSFPAQPSLAGAQNADGPAKSTCVADAESLCLQGGRFKVEVDWRTVDGATGRGMSIPGTDESGYFWFFSPTNVELAVKVLDGTAFNDRFWVFYGALSNVQYELTVTDTLTGQSRSYFNPQGEFCGFFDTDAF